jgi:hypothetical protein
LRLLDTSYNVRCIDSVVIALVELLLIATSKGFVCRRRGLEFTEFGHRHESPFAKAHFLRGLS